MTGRYAEELRTAWLFGKPYWWDRTPDRRLTLRPARWVPNAPKEPPR